MADVQVVGKVAVKLIPQTKYFRQDAKAELEKIEKRLPELTVKLKLDETGFKRDALSALRTLNAELRADDRYRVKFRAAIDEAGMRSAVRTAVKELNAIAKGQKVKFRVDTIAALLDVELDGKSKQRVERELKDWISDISPLVVSVQPDLTNGFSSAISARLAVLTRPRTVSIIPVLDNKAAAAVATTLAALAGARAVYDILDGIWDRLKNLDKAVPIIGTIAEAIAGLGGWALAASSNLFALSASLAQIGPATLTLPGIFAGFTFGVGSMIAVLKDFNDVFPDVQKSLSALQDAMSEKFWDVARKPMREMIDVLFPRFAAGLEQTAASLGIHFAALATSLTGTFKPIVEQLFADLNNSIEIAGSGTDAYAGILATLGSVGAAYLPRLAQWFVDISERFNNFLGAAAADGRLQQWIDNGIFQLSELGRVLGQVGGILAGIARAAQAAGGSTLTSLADTLERIHTFVDSPAFQEGLANVFRAAHEAMALIANISGPAVEGFFLALGELLTVVLPLAGRALGTAFEAIFSALSQPAVSQGIIAMFEGLLSAIQNLAPAMGPVGAALGAIFGIIGSLATAIGPVLSVAFSALANVLVALAPLIDGLIAALGPVLLQVVSTLGTALTGIAPVVSGMLQALLPAFSGLIGIVGQIATTLFPVLAKLIVSVLPILVNLFAVWWETLTPVLGILIDLAATVLPVLLSAIVPIIAGLGAVITQIMPQLLPVFMQFADMIANVLLPAILPLLPAFAQLVTSLLPVLGQVVVAILPLLSMLIGLIAGLATEVLPILMPILLNVVNVLSITLVGAVNILVATLDFFIGVIRGVWEVIAGIFTGDIPRALDGLKSLWDNAWKFVGKIVSTVIDTIKKVVSSGLDTAKEVFGTVLTKIKEKVSSGFENVKQAFGDALDKIKTKVGDGLDAVKQFFADLPGKIVDKLSGLGQTLFQSGVDMIQGLLDGAGSLLKNVGQFFLDKLPGWIQAPFKKALGIASPSKVFKGYGGNIVDGLVGGIVTNSSAVQSTMGNLATDIARVDMFGAGAGVVSSLVNGMESQLSSVTNALGAVSGEIAGSDIGALAAQAGAVSLASSIDASIADQPDVRVLQYFAAEGSSLGSEEDLFAAADRSRMMGW